MRPHHLPLDVYEIGYKYGNQSRSVKLSAEDEAKLAIKDIYNAVTAAHNTRQYDRSVYPWTKMAPNMTFEMAYGDPQHVDLDGYINASRALFGESLSLHVEILRCEVDVDLSRGTAIAYASHAMTSDEVGLVRRSVIVTNWRIDGTDWQCISFKHIKGMEI